MPALGESGRGMRALPPVVTKIHHIWTIVETSLTTQRWSDCWSAFVWLGIVYSGLASLPVSVRNSQIVLVKYLRHF